MIDWRTRDRDETARYGSAEARLYIYRLLTSTLLRIEMMRVTRQAADSSR